MLSKELAALFSRDLRRLTQEIEAFPDTQSLWKTVPGVTNAAGTLALHLEGNLREYIGRQLGRIAYTRDRPLEFNARGVEQQELVARLAAVAAFIPGVVEQLSDNTLNAPFPEQVLGVSLSSRQFLVHINGHLNYHLGQIDYLRRVHTGNGALALAGLS
ncbi:MAG TPA: DinB family protein [Vicinamibacterales bacterium]|nr:DinB family protein [Vicinamibacterales bacterium]